MCWQVRETYCTCLLKMHYVHVYMYLPPPHTHCSLPISVCWQIHSINSSQPMPFDPENDNDTPTCVSLNSSSLHYEMTFREKGKYEIVATFQNNISRVNLSYTFQVVEGARGVAGGGCDGACSSQELSRKL